MADFIYNEKGKNVAWIVDGKVFSGSNAQMIATSHERKIYPLNALNNKPVGHLQVAGLAPEDGVGISDAFTRLLPPGA